MADAPTWGCRGDPYVAEGEFEHADSLGNGGESGSVDEGGAAKIVGVDALEIDAGAAGAEVLLIEVRPA